MDSSSTSSSSTANKTKNVIVLGETGCGKSTFINCLTNYFRGGSLDNLKLAIPSAFLPATESDFTYTENNNANRSHSQTSKCHTYHFAKGAYDYAFIDTPGLNDTRGRDNDVENLEIILKAAEAAGDVSAIMLLINGTNARLTFAIINVLRTLRGHIPDSIVNNMVVVLTNCREDTANFEVASLGSQFPDCTVFYMDNSAFSTDPTTWDSRARRRLQLEWEDSNDTIRKVCDKLNTFSAVSSKDFKQMLDSRFQIKSTLHNAKLTINNMQRVYDELEKYDVIKTKLVNDIGEYAKYKKTRTITKTLLEDAPFHSTICAGCNSVCHNHCGLDEQPKAGSNVFKNCAAMNGTNHCHVCDGKCPADSHYHVKKQLKTITETVEDIVEDMKVKYDEINNKIVQADDSLSALQQEKLLLEKAMDEVVEGVKMNCRKLKEICKGFNLIDELNLTLKQMHVEATHLTSHKARDAAEKAIKDIAVLTEHLSRCDDPLLNASKGVSLRTLSGASTEAGEFGREEEGSQWNVNRPAALRT